MASVPDLVNYSVWRSFSKTLEIENFQKMTKANMKDEEVSSDDGSVTFSLFLWPSRTDVIVLALRRHKSCATFPPNSMIKLEVSLINVRGEKQFTQQREKRSSQLQTGAYQVQLFDREYILDFPATYLHNGTLKLLVEMCILVEMGSLSKPTLSSDNASLLANGAFSDVTLLVGEKEFHVHKAILSARSPVFARMFTGNIQESSENRIVFEEIHEHVFTELLNYIYTDRVENMPANATQLLPVAEMYQVEALRDLCCQHFSTSLRMTNLLSYLQFAHQHNVTQLKSECLAFFGQYSRQVKVTQEWKQLITVESDANQEILGLLIQTVLESDNWSSVDTVLESETGAMASPQAFAKPSSCQFFSKTIEIDNFQMKISKTDGKSVKVSSRDGSEQVCLYLWPSSRQLDKKETDNVVILLRTASHPKTRCTFPPNSMIKLDVSLITVKGEKHFTKCWGQRFRQLQTGVQVNFIPREDILASPDTYLHNGTLKVLFEVCILGDGSQKPSPLPTLSSDYASLLAKGSFSDVTLLVGEKEFPVHKAILSARSSVFARMFTQSTESRIVLEEIDEQVLTELLNYIYTDKVESLQENVAEKLLNVAGMYQLEVLKDICCQHLSATLTTDNLLSHLQLAYQHNVAQLQSECLTFFEQHSGQIKLTQEWNQLIAVQSDVNQKILDPTVLDSECPVKKVKLSQEP